MTPTTNLNGNVVTEDQVKTARDVIKALKLSKAVENKVIDELYRVMVQIKQIDIFED